ncbi:hypothetical protein, partial [Photorhabdus laumondii]|uniref:hypothetical protein n=1 Tax=Photorhabdus laumondii TaxID=2218628 RepID=UPI0019D48A7D
ISSNSYVTCYIATAALQRVCGFSNGFYQTKVFKNSPIRDNFDNNSLILVLGRVTYGEDWLYSGVNK